MRPSSISKKLLLACVLSFVGACKTTSNESSTKASDSGSGFVKTKGTQFTLDGKPFYFQGTNFYRVAMDKQFSEVELNDIFSQYSKNNITVVRFWGFSCDTPEQWKKDGIQPGFYSNNGSKPMLDANGKVNEEALVAMDKALDAARKNGVKIILPLVNFEHEYCGMEWWNYVYGNKGETKHGFFCNEKVISAYRKHVAMILRRKNTVNGRIYSEDPTIMAIELANEPHTKDGYETSGKVDESCKSKINGKPGIMVYNWLRDTSEYIRSLDKNHLLCSGEEGYRVQGDVAKHSWQHNGLKGVGFEYNVSLPNLDFATVHLYPDNAEVPTTDFDSWYVDNVVKDRAALAHTAGKPIVLEETGFSEFRDDGSSQMNKYKRMGYHPSRPYWLEKMFSAANEANYAGTMVWQAIPVRSNGTAYDDDDFSFSLNSPEGKVVIDQAMKMRAKNK